MKKNSPLIFFTLLVCVSCTSKPPDKEFWQVILDSIPWENKISGYVSMGMLTIPDELINVMYDNGYQYVNSTYLKEDIDEHIYELKKENVSYDAFDDTFVFEGEFYPDESNIWLVFSKDKNYPLYMGPEDINSGKYNLSRTMLKDSVTP